jgi:hypothetical protein
MRRAEASLAAKAAPVLRRSSVAAAVEKAVPGVRVVGRVSSLRAPSLRRAGIDDVLNDSRVVAEAMRSLGVSRLDVERDAKLLLGGVSARFSGFDG